MYYCGTPGHLPDEIKELLLKITIEEGGLSIEEAMAINNRHQIFIEAFQNKYLLYHLNSKVFIRNSI